jgi:predicted patatin/cPLA2 family phospholipase
MINTALVLEGGALRSLYTSGVLDVFMENGLEFPCVIGVSAGALNGANYIAKHIDRSAKINILHSNDSDYYGLKQLFFKKSIFNFDYLFYKPIKDLYPYNESALVNSKQRFLICATDCETSNAVYFEKNNYAELVKALQASSSIPFFCKTTNVDGKAYVDGSIADPVCVKKAFSEGYDKVVVVLTRHFEHKFKETSWLMKILYRKTYKKYPKLVPALEDNPSYYNSVINEINKMEQEKRLFVIRPSRIINTHEIEKNARKLLNLYFLGKDDARELLPKMFEYINQ